MVTGLISAARTDSSGNAGNIVVNIDEAINVRNGGLIASDTFASGSGGGISVTGRNLVIDGLDSIRFTGITTSSDGPASGDGGDIEIQANELIINGGCLLYTSPSPRDRG